TCPTCGRPSYLTIVGNLNYWSSVRRFNRFDSQTITSLPYPQLSPDGLDLSDGVGVVVKGGHGGPSEGLAVFMQLKQIRVTVLYQLDHFFQFLLELRY